MKFFLRLKWMQKTPPPENWSNDNVLLDDINFMCEFKRVSEIVRGLLNGVSDKILITKTLPGSDYKRLASMIQNVNYRPFEAFSVNINWCEEYQTSWEPKNGIQTLVPCHFRVVIETLRDERNVKYVTEHYFGDTDEEYVAVKIPHDIENIEWDIHHQDYYPHVSRSSLKGRTKQKGTMSLLYESDLENYNIEELEVFGRQSELVNRVNMTKKLHETTSKTGLFDEDVTEFEKEILKEIPQGYDILWLVVKSRKQ